jgi:hypothetical protein
MEIRIEGLDQLQRKLEDLERRARSLSGEHAVTFDEIFPQSFMRRHTHYQTIQEMLDASPWKVKNQADFAAIPDAPWDEFVQKSTRFRSWKEMQETAAEEYFARKLGLK